ncbi:hypothetical protein K435DRAFT_769209 [Dendrothele bispora CBS 962.96]|uniref:Ubiquitin-like domain-containing protein n=1 Tax=Dendrothele bispora (strain CBS 962.96) TaxID=1314807 RepID=A0A4S8KSH9_DENBC|nr:hypothetical protein K435DRAFT_769209 [Dendrothele bispora CBS 962.96]
MGNDQSTQQKPEKPSEKLLVFVHGSRKVAVSRPETYYAAVCAAQEHFPHIPRPRIVLKTKDLAICDGELLEISSDIWEVVREEARTVEVAYKYQDPSLYDRGSVHSYDGSFSIYVKSLTGKTIHYSVSLSDTVLDLKQTIQGSEGTPVDQYELAFMGQFLDDDRTLSEYNIQRNAILTLVPALGGKTTLRGKKPVIYLRAPKDIQAIVRLSLVPAWKFSAIYPMVPLLPTKECEGQKLEWTVTTRKDGTLHDHHTGMEVAYLYWEALANHQSLSSPPPSPKLDSSRQEYFDPAWPSLTEDNSVVLDVGKNMTNYLDKTLLSLGFDVEARTSFITFWLPELIKYQYVAIRFVNQAAYERAAPLDVTPKPDVVARVFMLFRGIPEDEIDEWSSASERAAEGVERWQDIVGVDKSKVTDESLYRVLEWGGMEVKY